MEGIFLPEWAGYGAIAVAAALLVWNERRRRRAAAEHARLVEEARCFSAESRREINGVTATEAICGWCMGEGTRPSYRLNETESCPRCGGTGVRP